MVVSQHNPIITAICQVSNILNVLSAGNIINLIFLNMCWVGPERFEQKVLIDLDLDLVGRII